MLFKLIIKTGSIGLQDRAIFYTVVFFLRGFLESGIYTKKVGSIDDLRNNIRIVIREKTPATCGKVIENLYNRTDICRHNRSAHLNNILFHV